MDGGMQAALALGVGYVLGRRRKVRRATVLAAAAAASSQIESLNRLTARARRTGA